VIQQVGGKLATNNQDFQQTEIKYLRLEKYFWGRKEKKRGGQMDGVDEVDGGLRHPILLASVIAFVIQK
jgi:hypothetical protein